MSHFTGQSLNKIAFSATLHCLLGCSIGEIVGMMLGTGLGWSNLATVVVSIVLAFTVGYSMTVIPLLRTGLALGVVIPLAFTADTVSITVMEIVDNFVMVVIPGAMNAQLLDPLFWGALALSIVLAGIAAFPVNRWLIAHHKGHSVIHHAMMH